MPTISKMTYSDRSTVTPVEEQPTSLKTIPGSNLPSLRQEVESLLTQQQSFLSSALASSTFTTRIRNTLDAEEASSTHQKRRTTEPAIERAIEACEEQQKRQLGHLYRLATGITLLLVRDPDAVADKNAATEAVAARGEEPNLGNDKADSFGTVLLALQFDVMDPDQHCYVPPYYIFYRYRPGSAETNDYPSWSIYKHTIPAYIRLPREKKIVAFLGKDELEKSGLDLRIVGHEGDEEEQAPPPLPQYLTDDIAAVRKALMALHRRAGILKKLMVQLEEIIQARLSNGSVGSSNGNGQGEGSGSTSTEPPPTRASSRPKLNTIKALDYKMTELSLRWDNVVARVTISNGVVPKISKAVTYAVSLSLHDSNNNSLQPQRDRRLENVILGVSPLNAGNSMEQLINRLVKRGWA